MLVLNTINKVLLISTKWFKYEIDAEISASSFFSVDINLPEQIIGFSKAHAIEVTTGRAKDGGKIWGRRSDKVLKIGINDQKMREALRFACLLKISEK